MTEKEKTVISKFNTEIRSKLNSPATHIEIFFKGQEMAFSKLELPIKLGRDDEFCRIVVDTEVASRVHCSIEVIDNQIGLLDSSSNGTFIKIGRNESFVIQDKFYPLIGQGMLCLGKDFEEEDSSWIYFRMVSR